MPLRPVTMRGIVLVLLLHSLIPSTLAAPSAPSSTEDVPPRHIPRTHIRHEWHAPEHTEGWARRGRADPEAWLPVRIGLAQSNLEQADALLMERSHPHAAKYGEHMSVEEVVDLFAPSDDTVAAVKSWLGESGVAQERLSISENKQWIQFDARVWEAEAIFHAQYDMFEHEETGVRNVGCTEYHIPKTLSEHIDYITPGIKLSPPGFEGMLEAKRKRRHHRERRQIKSDIWQPVTPDYDPTAEVIVTGGCEESITPDCIRKQYHIPNGTTSTPGNEMGVFQSLGQHYAQEDLDAFFWNLSPRVPNGTHPTLHSINGAVGPADFSNIGLIGEEANLDFQVAIPLIHPQRTILYQTDDEWYQTEQQSPDTLYRGFFNTLFNALDGSYCAFDAYGMRGNCRDPLCQDPSYPNMNSNGRQAWKKEGMCGAYKPANVISISYSGMEAGLPARYMRRQCLEVLKLGLQGVTVVESSGDVGVGGGRWDKRQGCMGEDKSVFAPRTMSNCPYVLSVGATVVVKDSEKEAKKRWEEEKARKRRRRGCAGIRGFRETATTSFASGGGFSNVFGMPSYQKSKVEAYLKNAKLPFSSYDNTVPGSSTTTTTTSGSTSNNTNAGPDGTSAIGTGTDNIPATLPLAGGGVFNRKGRAYPDVAAIGDNTIIVHRGYTIKSAGTSVAVPIWASILTLVNEERLKAGKSTVGFVNPVLYEHPEVFNDITEGSNPGCGSTGFPAAEGWDPVTGLGTPDYPKLLNMLMGIDNPNAAATSSAMKDLKTNDRQGSQAVTSQWVGQA